MTAPTTFRDTSPEQWEVTIRRDDDVEVTLFACQDSAVQYAYRRAADARSITIRKVEGTVAL